jgi:hypothetical protein
MRAPFIFVFDMSYRALELDFTQQMIRSIRSSLSALPSASHAGVVTMSDHLTFFDLSQKSELVIFDLRDLDVPVSCTSVLPRLRDCKANLAGCLDMLLAREPTDPALGHCVGSALSLCERLLSRRGGCVICGYVGLPSHRLRPRAVPTNWATLRLPELAVVTSIASAPSH